MRHSISKKIRFEVLNRDNFTCQYCGRTVKDGAKLEIDHIIPVSKGGTNIIGNLKTACWECNNGKRALFNWKQIKDKEITPEIIEAYRNTDWKLYAKENDKYKRAYGLMNATGMTLNEIFDYVEKIYYKVYPNEKVETLKKELGD